MLPHTNHSRSLSRWLIASFAILFPTLAIDGQEPDVTNALDPIAELQLTAIETKTATWGHWGVRRKSYSAWTNHSNRLIPVYTFGAKFDKFMGEGSLYRDAAKLEAVYRRMPEWTLDPEADYADQTDVYQLQRESLESGKKKYVILVVFDGMDWQTTHAAATYAKQQVAYTEGRGTGLCFQDYRGAETDFGYFVSSPHDDGLAGDPNLQTLTDDPATIFGGYNQKLGGKFPWSNPTDPQYLIGRTKASPHAVTDSSSSATSMTAGAKIFNGSINVTHDLKKLETIAHWVQREKNMSVGAVTSVPICHATPGAAYAHNTCRDDYQDITRDMLGLASISHPDEPLLGMDVVIGAGWGETSDEEAGQGRNAVPGNRYLSDEDLATITQRTENRYVAAVRTPGISGPEVLKAAAKQAAESNCRLFGFFGVERGHLPFRTANGDFKPVKDVRDAEVYSAADVHENPTLVDFARVALDHLYRNPNGFWLMVEAGDVDWANHANNIDSSIGAVLSGDAAVAEIFRWIESKNAWNESLVIVTADHGHYLNILDPAVLTKR